jgi:hypothetical protein
MKLTTVTTKKNSFFVGNTITVTHKEKKEKFEQRLKVQKSRKKLRVDNLDFQHSNKIDFIRLKEKFNSIEKRKWRKLHSKDFNFDIHDINKFLTKMNNKYNK